MFFPRVGLSIPYPRSKWLYMHSCFNVGYLFIIFIQANDSLSYSLLPRRPQLSEDVSISIETFCILFRDPKCLFEFFLFFSIFVLIVHFFLFPVVATDVYCKLTPNVSSEKIWVWTVMDFAEGELKNEQFALKFGQVERKILHFKLKIHLLSRLFYCGQLGFFLV